MRWGYANTEKVLYCFYKITLKIQIRANLKRHNRVYLLPSKQTHRPERAREVAQLFYTIQYTTFIVKAEQSLYHTHTFVASVDNNFYQKRIKIRRFKNETLLLTCNEIGVSGTDYPCQRFMPFLISQTPFLVNL